MTFYFSSVKLLVYDNFSILKVKINKFFKTINQIRKKY